MAAATGMTSNVTDLAKFISAQFRGGSKGGANVLSAGSWREALRVRELTARHGCRRQQGAGELTLTADCTLTVACWSKGSTPGTRSSIRLSSAPIARSKAITSSAGTE